ncbi:hypothetical protein FQR65_LT06774 [Abscondita terminalis]|nr:hypothetical protein FQR65_LT06774 [Abscondita terminalis]
MFSMSNRFEMTTCKTVLVTGGAGYIGSHTIIELLNNNHTVIALDNFSNSNNETRNEKPECIKRVEQITGKLLTFYPVDVCDKMSLIDIFHKHKIDCVIHLAGFKYVGESVKTPLPYYVNNISSSLVLFEVMQDCNVKNLIFSSSSNVYGNPEFLPVTEDHPTGQKCTNPYAKSKYFIEEMLQDLCNSNPEWRVISLRYFTASGAHKSGMIGENPLSVHLNLIPRIAQVAAGQKSQINVFGYDYDTKDGTCVRDYTHINDIAVGHIKALDKINQKDFRGWLAYNLGSGKGYTVLEVIKTFEKVSKKAVKYELYERRKGDIKEMYADSTKAKTELGWNVEEDIDGICRDVWNWQLNNPNGFKKC